MPDRAWLDGAWLDNQTPSAAPVTACPVVLAWIVADGEKDHHRAD